ANRIGFSGNGGPFSLMQLKVIQEVITLFVFVLFSSVYFKGESLHWNHLAAFICLVAAVYFVFLKP
ncbi:DMT family protein, partial [Bacteroides sp.]